jgi:hypothetical protein
MYTFVKNVMQLIEVLLEDQQNAENVQAKDLD